MKNGPETAAFIKKETRKSLLKRLPWLALIPLGYLLPQISAQYPAFVDRVYSNGIYPVVNAVLRTIYGIFPFSVAEWLLYAVIILGPLLLLIRGLRAIFGRERWVRFLHLCITYLILFGVALNTFYIVWGFQYSRPTLGTLLQLDVHDRPVEELETLCVSLAKTAEKLRGQVPEDDNGVFRLPGTVNACFTEIPQAYQKLGKAIPLFRMPATKPKPVFASEGMSWAGISGIFIPFTAEPNVNVHQPALLLPASAAHECAHGLGIARENEANFVSYLACLYADDASIRYSGVMLALINSGNQLYREDPELYQTLYDSYSEGMKRDLRAHNAYWKQYDGPFEEAVDQMNNSYLKHNRQESGVKSYGEMVDLLLAWQADGRSGMQ